MFQAPSYKTFFMLNSAEPEICPAYKSQIINNCKFFLAEQLFLAFSYLLAEKISCSAELSMKIRFITSWPDLFYICIMVLLQSRKERAIKKQTGHMKRVI